MSNRMQGHISRHHTRSLLAVGAFLPVLVAMFVAVLTGCSGLMLTDDGRIIDPNGEVVTGQTNSSVSTPVGSTSAQTEPSRDPAETEAPLPFGDAEHAMHVEFLRTGESDCILILMEDTVILLDTGDADDYETISATLKGYGIETVDYLILSHFDNDHIGSADRLLRQFSVTNVYMPDYVRRSSRYRAMVAALEEVPDTVVHRLWGEDVHIELGYGSLWINASSLFERGSSVGSDKDETLVTDENNYSLITSVYFGDVSLFLPGDAERDRMEEFNALTEVQRYTLVKTPHHGGYDMGLGTFLDRALPKYCVITTDTAATMDPDLDRKIRMMASKRFYTFDGDVIFSTDGTATQVRQ